MRCSSGWVVYNTTEQRPPHERSVNQSISVRPVMDSFLDGANDMLGDARGFYTDRHSSEHRPA